MSQVVAEWPSIDDLIKAMQRLEFQAGDTLKFEATAEDALEEWPQRWSAQRAPTTQRRSVAWVGLRLRTLARVWGRPFV
jgi:hypothetical protein